MHSKGTVPPTERHKKEHSQGEDWGLGSARSRVDDRRLLALAVSERSTRQSPRK